MKKLVELEEQALARGTVLRFPGAYPYEGVVDFMLVESPETSTRLMLVVSSGYKSGIISVVPPAETSDKYEGVGFSSSWLSENWKKRVYNNCELGDVLVLDHYPAPAPPIL